MTTEGYDFWKNNTCTILIHNGEKWVITKERSFPIGTNIRICPGEDIKKKGLYGIWGRKYHIWFDSVYERLADDYYFNEFEKEVKKENGEINLENYKKYISNNKYFGWEFETNKIL